MVYQQNWVIKWFFSSVMSSVMNFSSWTSVMFSVFHAYHMPTFHPQYYSTLYEINHKTSEIIQRVWCHTTWLQVLVHFYGYLNVRVIVNCFTQRWPRNPFPRLGGYLLQSLLYLKNWIALESIIWCMKFLSWDKKGKTHKWGLRCSYDSV